MSKFGIFEPRTSTSLSALEFQSKINACNLQADLLVNRELQRGKVEGSPKLPRHKNTLIWAEVKTFVFFRSPSTMPVAW